MLYRLSVERDKVKEDGFTIADWLQNLSTFNAAVRNLRCAGVYMPPQVADRVKAQWVCVAPQTQHTLCSLISLCPCPRLETLGGWPFALVPP